MTPGEPNRSGHWDTVYQTKGAGQVSWFQPKPTMSLQLIEGIQPASTDPIIDIGGGASTLVDHLLDDGHVDLTVLDVSGHALGLARHRLGARAAHVHWHTTDLLRWTPRRRFALWHDRAVFHFLTDRTDQARYRDLATSGIVPGGHLIVASFAADGPEYCSGLPAARYHPDQLAAQFSPAFTVVTARREHHRTPGGADQPFTWLVLRRATS